VSQIWHNDDPVRGLVAILSKSYLQSCFGMSFAYPSARDSMMTRTEEMLLLMEVGIGVREAVFVTTGMLPLDVAESARADYERDIKTRLRNSFSEPKSARRIPAEGILTSLGGHTDPGGSDPAVGADRL
jgi:hypothetical protein